MTQLYNGKPVIQNASVLVEAGATYAHHGELVVRFKTVQDGGQPGFKPTTEGAEFVLTAYNIPSDAGMLARFSVDFATGGSGHFIAHVRRISTDGAIDCYHFDYLVYRDIPAA